MKSCFGVDVCKKYLDYAQKDQPCVRVANNDAGVRALVEHIQKHKHPLVIVESTGGYESLLLQALLAAQIPVSRVNPRQVRDFAKGIGKQAKSDGIDASVLARFGEVVDVRLMKVVDDTQEEINEIVRRRRDLVDARSAEMNRKKQASERLQGTIQRHIDFLDKQVKELDALLARTVKASPQSEAKSTILRSVKGVGPVLTVTLLAMLPELGTVSSKQVAALVGLAPYINESGDSNRKRHIRGGRQSVRDVLYMATQCGIKFNDRLKAFYDRMIAAGKERKVAHIAAAHKLLTWLNAMVKHGQTWDKNILPVGG